MSTPERIEALSARLRERLRLRPAELANLGPLDLHLLGRTLLHAAVVGAACGAIGSLFFGAVEMTQHLLLERLSGYSPLRAAGEQIGQGHEAGSFKPWLLCLIPAFGALGGSLLALLAPEIRGGGADATIAAFHRAKGVVRRRVLPLKAIASILTLGSGGSGGREGPTIQIGGAIGSLVGRYFKVSVRERRVLLLAGVAAGISAVFRTPLGAALLAVEVLYKDDFESEALVPAVLASVVSYSVTVSILGESTLFAHAPRYPFVPTQLPLYALMAVMVSLAAAGFVHALEFVKKQSERLPIRVWMKPALGGLLLGVMATVLIIAMGRSMGAPGRGLGVLGGGYGAAQVAITGAPWLPSGWDAVSVLLCLGLVKIVATALTVGTGGSAGDFGPSLVIGGLLGGAFGRAAQLLFQEARIEPGAFALVGMGAFYGGIARAPLSALVFVCEMAGSYDLLVPLMLAEGVAYVALRNQAIYHAQVPTRRESPAHRGEIMLDVLEGVLVRDVMATEHACVTFSLATSATEIVRRIDESEEQEVFPVLKADGTMAGVIDAVVLRTLAAERELEPMTIAADLMAPATSLAPEMPIAHALQKMLEQNLREVPVVDGDGQIIGTLDEADITQAYLSALNGRDASLRKLVVRRCSLQRLRSVTFRQSSKDSRLEAISLLTSLVAFD